MTRALVADWRAADGTREPVLLQIGMRQSDGRIAVGLFAPSLEDEVGDLIGIILLPADEAAQLLDRVMRGLDQAGETEKVNRKLSARKRALSAK